MKREDYALIIGVGVLAGIMSLIISGLLFNAPAKRSTQVPTVQPINAAFPDIKNDPAYQAFLNNTALDPTQPIHIGNGQNNTPFQNSTQ